MDDGGAMGSLIPPTLVQPLTWTIVALALAGVIVRPGRWPEWIWAVAGAAALVAGGLLPAPLAWAGVRRGTDVYLFLAGMMLLAEVARQEGVFDWFAAHATRAARGSATRLFDLVYLLGVLTTVFLSNDATAVVLTPAVAAMARTARARAPLPHLLACAFVANAASFLLPISNPANLVVYGGRPPALGAWLAQYGVAAGAAILVTWAGLRGLERRALRLGLRSAEVPPLRLGRGGRWAALGIGLAAAGLLACSALGLRLGPPSLALGAAVALSCALRARRSPWGLVRRVSWGVLPLVGGLFVLVAALVHTGAIAALAALLRAVPAAGAGAGMAVLCNLANNLPVGLIGGAAVQGAGADLSGAVLVGIDLGPNLSVTGSLATLLWLAALRREGIAVSAGVFLRRGAVLMPVALAAALAGLLL